ncbi:putative ABC transport system permease protein [Tissierella praeacuta DSM 18095]|uniref:Putative ABC transport system permease protein n=1 Tax=Tissierella praeacuta DSM 18095 TaxID=1123404 RepID=A0A1M4TID6_9FIRM|nr:ABC transporter permease [Tissierella praeacuta]TCU77506.1 putative ABC transport system permease protein [Tissierella praeacuta]SHE44178.1 putative ABC transport system permease protein [Tissierella praeacuta DSM 18095]SUP04607.1 Macrolide export ATP-binding/permease protein MacB [Tissierella praeacuta]
MNIFESIQVSLSAILANKMRSLLTMLGIIIGISSVITVVALGEGGQKLIDKEFEQFGAGRAYLSMNWSENHLTKDLLTHDDIDVLRDTFPDDLEAIVPGVNERGKVRTKSKKFDIKLTGADENYIKIENVDIIKGRYLTDADVKGKRSVAIIDKGMALDAFGRTDILGESIDIELGESQISLVIIGVYEKPRSSLQGMGEKGHGSIFLPYTNLEQMTGGGDRFWDAQLSIRKGIDTKAVTNKMISLIERRHGNEGENKYIIQTAEGELQSINKITGIITVVIGAIAAISLLVGGIGVMNIMFVSVTERTREIGTRKAIGARRKDILLQFLVESVIVSGIGGIIGTIIGVGLAFIVSSFIKIPPSVSIKTIAIAWLFSAGVGIFFGIYPANKASKLDPIDALRYE